ncbi:MAG TPA: transcriptional regulator [Nitrospinota bacterium]|nr:transcriptional regulator [Nitrospinota bacterium]
MASFPPKDEKTIRQQIVSLLEGDILSAREISGSIGISEKEVYQHLENIRKTLKNRDQKLIMTSCECRKCGFVFKKRTRLKKPGRCPLCRSENIEESNFAIK